MKAYVTVARELTCEQIIKRSRFVTTIAPVEGYENALSAVADIKARYSDATHNCYAFIGDSDGQSAKFSDDGEPQGTAGQPILEVIKKSGLSCVLIVVTRYFGGVKLGAKGLVGAYSASASGAVSAADKINMVYSNWLTVATDYSVKGKLDAAIMRCGGEVILTDYSEGVATRAVIPAESVPEAERIIADLTCGKGTIIIEKSGYYPYTIKRGEV